MKWIIDKKSNWQIKEKKTKKKMFIEQTNINTFFSFLLCHQSRLIKNHSIQSQKFDWLFIYSVCFFFDIFCSIIYITDSHNDNDDDGICLFSLFSNSWCSRLSDWLITSRYEKEFQIRRWLKKMCENHYHFYKEFFFLFSIQIFQSYVNDDDNNNNNKNSSSLK